ncbi:TRAP transporter large permease [Chloroflexota bacterium]
MITFIAVAFGSFLLLLASGMWVAIAAALVGMAVLFVTTGWDNMLLASSWVIWVSVDSFVLTAIPLFIFMGQILMQSGLGARIYTAVEPTLNHFPGGLLYTNIVAGALFAACTGSSSASAATIGSVAFPEMDKRGYPPSMSAGSVGAGAVLAPIIPPSILLIFYASITEQSIGRLFAAGVIPGLILVVLFLIYITIRFRFYGHWGEHKGEVLPWKTSLARTKDVWLVFALIVMVLGSIFAGIATPTEAAAVGSFGAILLAGLHRRLSWQMLRNSVFGVFRINCALMFIMFGVKIMTAAFARAGLVHYATQVLLDLSVPSLVVLLIIYGVFLILGTMIEGIPLMLMVVPVVFPTIIALGYDPIWFGLAVTLLQATGNFTPPVGVTLFALQALRPERPVTEIYRGLIPFTIAVLVLLAIITAFPQLVMILPNAMLGE